MESVSGKFLISCSIRFCNNFVTIQKYRWIAYGSYDFWVKKEKRTKIAKFNHKSMETFGVD